MTDDNRTIAQSFSGTHPYRPQCLLAMLDENFPGMPAYTMLRAAEITNTIDAGRCPRCEGPLPTEPIWPAGSIATQCRCIPICGNCGDDESNQCILEDSADGPWAWPVDPEGVARRTETLHAHVTTTHVYLDAAQCHTLPTGGWAQHGYDDTADRNEMAR